MRTMMWILALALASGCVSKGKYGELEAAYDAQAKELKTAEANLDRALDTKGTLENKLDKRMGAFVDLFKDMMKIEKRGLADVTIEDGRAVIGLESDVLFASGSAELTPKGREAVIEIAKVLSARTDGRFQVEGHTDSDAISSKTYPDNWHLGAARALTVVGVMVDAGMPAERLSAASYGAFAPVASNADAAGKRSNRRIELVFMPELKDFLPSERVMKRASKKK